MLLASLSSMGARFRAALAAITIVVPFVFLAAFALVPLLQQGVGSFYNWFEFRPSTFAGVNNYAQLFADPVARIAAVHTLEYVALTVPLEVGLGLAGAWLTLQVRRGRGLLATLFVLPLVVPWPGTTTLFLGIFAQDGVLNGLRAHLLGTHQPVLWFQNPASAFAVIMIIGIWKGTPWCYLLLLGALGTSPVEVFEAGRMDGARGVSFWLHVVLPSVRPMLVFVTVFRVLAEAQTFTSVSLLTQGGPINGTELTPYYSYQLAFQYFQFGTASAMGTLLGAALLLVAVVGISWIYGTPNTVARVLTFPAKMVTPLGAACRTVSERVLEHRRSSSNARWSSAGLPPRWRAASSATWNHRASVGLVVTLAIMAVLPFVGGLPNGAEIPDTSLPWSTIASSLWNSVVVTLATVLGTLLLAVPAAYVLARVKFRLRRALFLVVLVTLAIPGVVLLLPQYQEIAWLGLINTRVGLVLLYIAANLPLAVFFLRPAFASVPEELVESMRVDGASTSRIVVRLLVPLSMSTIVAVAVFVVMLAWSELPLAVTLINSPSLYTLPVLIAMNIGGLGVLGASWISMAPPLLLFLVCQRTFRRGLLSRALL